MTARRLRIIIASQQIVKKQPNYWSANSQIAGQKGEYDLHNQMLIQMISQLVLPSIRLCLPYEFEWLAEP